MHRSLTRRTRAQRARWPAMAVAAAALAATVAVPADAVRAQDRLASRPVETWYLDDVQVDRDQSGMVELYLRALTSSGSPAELVPPWPFEIAQDSDLVDPSKVQAVPLEETDLGVACVLILDISPSVEPTFPQARTASVQLIDRLRAYDRLSILTFSGDVRRLAEFDNATAEKRSRVANLELDRAPAATRLYDAVAEGIAQLRRTPDLPRRRVVIVYTDGRDGGSQTKREDLLRMMQRTSEPDDVPILLYVIAAPDESFGRVDLTEVRTIASAAQTELRVARLSYELQAFFDDVWEQVAGSYVVRYPARLDGAEHEIDVTMLGRTERVLARFPEGIFDPLVIGLLIGAAVLLIVLLVVLIARVSRRGAGRLVLVGAGPGKSFALKRGANTIGWLAENDVVLASPTISKLHAIIHVYRDGVEIEDQNSTNGTLVNDKPISRAPLSSGDRIRFADLETVYRA